MNTNLKKYAVMLNANVRCMFDVSAPNSSDAVEQAHAQLAGILGAHTRQVPKSRVAVTSYTCERNTDEIILEDAQRPHTALATIYDTGPGSSYPHLGSLSRGNWKTAVASDKTQQGYWPFVAHGLSEWAKQPKQDAEIQKAPNECPAPETVGSHPDCRARANLISALYEMGVRKKGDSAIVVVGVSEEEAQAFSKGVEHGKGRHEPVAHRLRLTGFYACGYNLGMTIDNKAKG